MSHNIYLSIPVEMRFHPTHGDYKSEIGGRSLRFQYGKRDPSAVEFFGEMKTADPWKVREDLLRPQEPLMAFTAKYGQFGRFPDLQATEQDWDGEREFRQWRRFVRRLMDLPREKWDSLAAKFPAKMMQPAKSPFPLAIGWRDDKPVGVITVTTARDAVIASIQIDKLLGRRYRYCARRDCRKSFERTTNHDKIYCDTPCAHLAAVRASRARKARKRRLQR